MPRFLGAKKQSQFKANSEDRESSNSRSGGASVPYFRILRLKSTRYAPYIWLSVDKAGKAESWTSALMSEDRQLLKALQRGENAAWRQIYLKYKDDLLTVYIDIDRKLPIAATYDHTQPDGTVLRESDIEFKYPETGPADIYEAGAPRSAQIKHDSEQ